MRHFSLPHLERPSHYVVFCDCGREIKRFSDRKGVTGKEQFDTWLEQAEIAEQWCAACYEEKIEEAISEAGAEQTTPSPFQTYINDLSISIRQALGQMDLSRATLDEKREAAKKISHLAATACAALALQPIPIADVFVLTPIQILLVQSIGRIYGVPLTAKTAFEVATNIGLGVLLRQIFISMIKIGLPVMGGLLTSTYVYMSTYYMGRVAQIYFEKGRPLTPEELQEVQTSRSRAEERLRELEHLKKSDLITEEEYQRKRTQIVEEI
jgi:uncharacterized protein (DUF697 family)